MPCAKRCHALVLGGLLALVLVLALCGCQRAQLERENRPGIGPGSPAEPGSVDEDAAARIAKGPLPEMRASVEGTVALVGQECWRVRLLQRERGSRVISGETWVRVSDGRIVRIAFGDESPPIRQPGDTARTMIAKAERYARDLGFDLVGWEIRRDMRHLERNESPLVTWSPKDARVDRIPPLLAVSIQGKPGRPVELRYLDLSAVEHPQVVSRKQALEYAKVDWFGSRTSEDVSLVLGTHDEQPTAVWDVVVQEERQTGPNLMLTKSGWWLIDAVTGDILEEYIDPGTTYSPM